MDGELRYWIPIGGTDFAGDIIRYGAAIHYDIFRNGDFWVKPVAEVVCWTVLDGKQNVLSPFGVRTVEDAAGDTIVNVKAGLRVGLGEHLDVYGGYGRPVTGDRWYENIMRLELRWRY